MPWGGAGYGTGRNPNFIAAADFNADDTPDIAATNSGSNNLSVLLFRHYLGGSLASHQYVSYDVDADGSPEVLFVVGGALVAKTPRDVLVWETPALSRVVRGMWRSSRST